MPPFNATDKAPGIYIEEVQVPGPIAGVGTSTAAFIGPAQQGQINKPILLTNFTQFQDTFGDYITTPLVYAAHAVRGFFDNGGATCYFVRVGGQNNDITQIQPSDYKSAIDELKRVDDINILCIPDRVDEDIQRHMITHCENMKDRFAILDPQPDATPSNGIKTQRQDLGSDNGYAALYYPWIVIANPSAEGRLTVPPSGHIAGVYARTDGTRGVHKAPANEPIRGALDLELKLTDAEQGPLNELGINVLRSFPGRGVVVWGARTTAPPQNRQWQYVNVRRLMLFIEESIQEGTQFAVFEPNDLALWEKVKRQVTEFLTRVWRDGALFGATPAQAFRVRVDETLNPPGERALGKLVIEVIVFPVTPAEFIVFRVIQQPGGPSVQE